MSTVFDRKRNQVPITVLEIGPCYVTQIKTLDKDGYQAVQIGYADTKENKITKPIIGHIKKAGAPSVNRLTEFKTAELEKYTLGAPITVEAFSVGDKVTVSARSKGRGFQGVVRRYHFAGGPKTHGQSDRLRAPGSIGASSFPSRVIKGMRMPGHMGNKKVTMCNLLVIDIDVDKNLLTVKGSVPGYRNTPVEVRKG
jgi:large subunit ribosomal protein L3